MAAKTGKVGEHLFPGFERIGPEWDERADKVLCPTHFRLGINQIVAQQEVLVACAGDPVSNRNSEVGLAPPHGFGKSLRSVVTHRDGEVDVIIGGKHGNHLGKAARVVDFEMFRETLETWLYKNRMTNAGARLYDPVLMFKVLVLQRMYNWVVGFARNAARNTLTNLVYNVCRYEQVERLGMN